MLWIYNLIMVVFSLLSTGHANFLLTITPAKLEIGITEELTLDCDFRGNPSATQFQSITRVRILKDTGGDNFEIVAEARDFETGAENIGLGPSANVSGFVGDVASSYLSVHWDLVTSIVLGKYRCDIVGFKPNQDVLIERSPEFILQESNVTLQDVIDLTIKQKADLEQQLQAQKNYCDNKMAVIETTIDTKIVAVKIDQENSSKAFEKQLLDHIAGVAADVERLMDTGVLQYWPQGTYALLMPDSGCPNNVGAQWLIGQSKFHTESTDRNYDQISASTHLMAPILERVGINNYVYQHFCVSGVLSPGADWPKGAYCINRVSSTCPNGFTSGAITWQDEITDSHANYSGSLPDGAYTANKTVILYCCRNDGPQDNAIYLPKSRPFYLYRYNGTCQEVVGMQTIAEYMLFDTDNSNGDAYENSFHPDGSINNVRIELCYYIEK